MADVLKLYCAGCGSPRGLHRFGISEDFTFDPERLPRYDLQLRLDHIGGRGKLSVERGPMPLEAAQALRASLAEALTRLDAEIAEATAGAGG